MDIDFIAFDSFGVKSMCTSIATKDCRIVIDPGIAYETGSFPCSFAERIRLVGKYEKRIKEACKKADIIIITHYHYDHHIPEAGMYKDKILIIKDPKKNINRSQRKRAEYFLSLVNEKAKEIRMLN